MSDDTAAAMERLTSMESLYVSAVSRVEAAERAVMDLESMAASMGLLLAQYHGNWADDRETVAELDPQLAVLGEDTVWDLHTRQHEVMARLMRLCAGYFAGSK
ncbi:DUF4298 domain-containing protein [Actinomyces trachealis]|uniref:DUF4298 domain-containing protein n=1 Tax=Actinomyces trachealis TaxID=2763540 RepID=UPI0018928ED5|nr:DUF4298 domain-containing protein [Actinomyces trachealis]